MIQTSVPTDSKKRLRLKPNCPFSSLNEVFPEGIPVFGNEPRWGIQGMDCWELDPGNCPSPQELKTIAETVFSDETPMALLFFLMNQGRVAIPHEWVEEVA